MDILIQKGVKTQKIKETEYVYIDNPYWDKDKKQNRHKREYIGKLSEDGEFIPNKKYFFFSCRRINLSLNLQILLDGKRFYEL